jgi:hypothetical protein
MHDEPTPLASLLKRWLRGTRQFDQWAGGSLRMGWTCYASIS